MKNKAIRALKTFVGIANPRTWGPLVETFETTKFDHAFGIGSYRSSDVTSIGTPNSDSK
jgi:hypothetical protein